VIGFSEWIYRDLISAGLFIMFHIELEMDTALVRYLTANLKPGNSFLTSLNLSTLRLGIVYGKRYFMTTASSTQ
jgi:hypothetical protein